MHTTYSQIPVRGGLSAPSPIGRWLSSKEGAEVDKKIKEDDVTLAHCRSGIIESSPGFSVRLQCTQEVVQGVLY